MSSLAAWWSAEVGCGTSGCHTPGCSLEEPWRWCHVVKGSNGRDREAVDCQGADCHRRCPHRLDVHRVRGRRNRMDAGRCDACAYVLTADLAALRMEHRAGGARGVGGRQRLIAGPQCWKGRAVAVQDRTHPLAIVIRRVCIMESGGKLRQSCRAVLVVRPGTGGRKDLAEGSIQPFQEPPRRARGLARVVA